MARPRIHPRRHYRAIETGFYTDQETGDELTYYKGVTVLPDSLIEGISTGRQEKMAKKLVEYGVFEVLGGDLPEPPEVEEATARMGEKRGD